MRRKTGQALLLWTGAGAAAGIVLGGLLYAAENVLKLKIYTLLMNIDYIPFLKNAPLPAAGEFALHLAVSIGLCLLLGAYFLRSRDRTIQRITIVSAIINTAIGAALYPTTLLSERTPALLDWKAASLWLAGHTVYGMVAGWLIGMANRKISGSARDRSWLF